MSNNLIIGVFDDEFRMVSALEDIKEKGIEVEEAFTPYPVHEVIHLMGKRSRLQVAAYFYGLFGAVAILAFLYYTSVIDWPIVYGGKPFNSFPSFIIITIVLTIFIVTIASLGTFSARSKLWPGQKKHPVYDHRATDDKFVIVLPEPDEKAVHGMGAIQALLKEHGASEVYVQSEEQKKTGQ